LHNKNIVSQTQSSVAQCSDF